MASPLFVYRGILRDEKKGAPLVRKHLEMGKKASNHFGVN